LLLLTAVFYHSFCNYRNFAPQIGCFFAVQKKFKWNYTEQRIELPEILLRYFHNTASGCALEFIGQLYLLHTLHWF